MRLLAVSTFQLHEFHGEAIPPYAILSHRWETGEVSFSDVRTDVSRQLQGWHKIYKCCAQAVQDGLDFVWIDTCCIDKSSSAELSEAINSMYRWYQGARVCYTYMSDVFPDPHWRDFFKKSKWFTRGWTLQELLAPRHTRFFDRTWVEIGTRDSLWELLHSVTGIRPDDPHDVSGVSIARRMSWAANRTTTMEEDTSYCLLGLFNVSMPLLYGEGRKQAFLRLQLEIIRQSDDDSIYAWSGDGSRSGLLASSPDNFKDSSNIVSLGFKWHEREPTSIAGALRVRFRIRRFYPDGKDGVLYHTAQLLCARGGSLTLLTIFLIRQTYLEEGIKGSDKYCKVGPLEESKKTFWKDDLKTIYVLQEDKHRWTEGYEGLHDFYLTISERGKIRKKPDPCWQIKDTDLDRKAFIWALRIRGILREHYPETSILQDSDIQYRLWKKADISETEAETIYRCLVEICLSGTFSESPIIIRSRKGVLGRRWES